jgi:hypothetical protein
MTTNSIMIISECEALDATCSESLSSVSFTWQPFNDDESGIVRYFISFLNYQGVEMFYFFNY